MAAADGFFGETQRVLLQATAGEILEKRQKKFHKNNLEPQINTNGPGAAKAATK